MAIEKTQTLVPGTRLVGRYHKADHVCEVVETADEQPFRLADGTTFKSLSAAAKAITNCSVNGWLFWSLPGATTTPAAKTPKQAAAKKPAAKKGGRVKQIKKMPSQAMVEAGKTKWFCSACMASFVTDGTDAPAACPAGHTREVEDEFETAS